MRRFFCLLMLSALILTTGCMGAACGEVIPAQEPGQQIGYIAVVLCEELTMRQKPDASSGRVKTLHFGDMPIVVGADSVQGPQEENGFLYCVLGDAEDSPSGWIRADYIFINPAWYITEKDTAVYAWDDLSAPKVAMLDKDTRLPILKEEGDWYLVSLRGAVGWIHK